MVALWLCWGREFAKVSTGSQQSMSTLEALQAAQADDPLLLSTTTQFQWLPAHPGTPVYRDGAGSTCHCSIAVSEPDNGATAAPPRRSSVDDDAVKDPLEDAECWSDVVAHTLEVLADAKVDRSFLFHVGALRCFGRLKRLCRRAGGAGCLFFDGAPLCCAVHGAQSLTGACGIVVLQVRLVALAS